MKEIRRDTYRIYGNGKIDAVEADLKGYRYPSNNLNTLYKELHL